MHARTSRLTGLILLTLTLQSAYSEDAYVEGEVLVTFKPGIATEGARTALKKHSMEWSQHFAAISDRRNRPMGLVRKSSRTTAQLIADLKADDTVETVEPNYIRHVSTTSSPDDTYFTRLWGLSNTGQAVNSAASTSGVDTKFVGAWKLANSSASEVVVGVIDTGVDIGHPDLAANIWTNPSEIAGNGIDDDGDGYVDDVHGYDFASSTPYVHDSGYHGTHVAGTIAAVGKNGAGVIGVDYKAKILPMVVSTNGEDLTTSAVISAMNYAVTLKNKGVNIVAINASYGGSSFSTTEQSGIQALNNAGIILCAAAGNDGTNNDTTASYPANYSLTNIISVAALTQTGSLADFSNYGATTVDLAAPGANIYSTMPRSLVSGTMNVKIGSTTYSGTALEFSGFTESTGLSGQIYNCGIGNTTDFPSGVSGNIALIQRGTLNFSTKVANAMSAGAAAVIVYDNTSSTQTISWTLGTAKDWVPVIGVTQAIGTALTGQSLPASGTVTNYHNPLLAYQYLDGTSMATPHVTGAVALAAANYPGDTVAQRVARITGHTTPLTSLTFKTVSGGMLNLQGIMDTDGDGLPDWWETAHFGSLAATATGDEDGDGDPNLDEFLEGNDPMNAASHLAFSSYVPLADSSGGFVLSFPTAVDRFYTVEWSTTLEAGSWTTLGTSVTGTGGTVQVTDPGALLSAERRFYRLSVSD